METTLRLLSGAAWAYAYWRIIRVSRQDRSYGIPLFAAALNLSWELIYFTGGIIYWSKYGVQIHIQTAVNGVWMLLDIGIATTIVCYGRREFQRIGPICFILMLSAIVAVSAMLQTSFLFQFPPKEAGQLSAFLQNIYMSGAYISMALVRADRRGQRLDIAVAKLIGTLAATISVSLSGEPFLGFLILGGSCFFFDFAYIFILRHLPSYSNSPHPPASSRKTDFAGTEHQSVSTNTDLG